MIKQDAFAAVPSRRAVRVDRRGLGAAGRALGRETALQPTSGQCARSLGVTAPRHAELAAHAGSIIWFCFAASILLARVVEVYLRAFFEVWPRLRRVFHRFLGFLFFRGKIAHRRAPIPVALIIASGDTARALFQQIAQGP